jgi:hypothetical protein
MGGTDCGKLMTAGGRRYRGLYKLRKNSILNPSIKPI